MGNNVILFGQLKDIAGSETIAVGQVADTNGLIQAINGMHPAMKAVKYLIAVDKKVVKENTAISPASVIALLPPFSGG